MPSIIPREKALGSLLALLTEGYTCISKCCEQLQSAVFEPSLLLNKATCVLGEDAAAMFYRPGRFTRQRALPPTALLLLQDPGSVQLLEGDAHRPRKQPHPTCRYRK